MITMSKFFDMNDLRFIPCRVVQSSLDPMMTVSGFPKSSTRHNYGRSSWPTDSPANLKQSRDTFNDDHR